MLSDTIAAISTAPGEAGIAVIRISGPASLSIADRLFTASGRRPSERPPFSAIHGWISHSGQVIDEVLLLIMRTPHSYTREDVVEFQCHGGAISARRILQAVLQAGARLAEPGEFTLRAFLNGRIDLVQAEAVLDLIRARSDRAASAAMEQLEGKLSSSFEDVYNSLVGVNADLEALLDFSEDDISPVVLPDALKRMMSIQKRLHTLLDTWEEGHLLREGALVVISGKTNVGKSTLLNALLGKDRAIVSPTPGTTRDSIEETIILDGIPIRLVDTAGLRATQCKIESEGVKRARCYIQRADLHLYLIDISQLIDEEDYTNIKGLDPRRSIVVLNKADLGFVKHLVDNKQFTTVISSLLLGKGLPEIRQSIIQKLGSLPSRPPHAVISERHRQILVSVDKELGEVITMLQSLRDEIVALCASRIRTAIELLGHVTGKSYYNELLNSIFSKFCIGK